MDTPGQDQRPPPIKPFCPAAVRESFRQIFYRYHFKFHNISLQIQFYANGYCFLLLFDLETASICTEFAMTA